MVGAVCPWAGRRGVELVLGKVDRIVAEIDDIPLRLNVRFLLADWQQRAALLAQANSLARKIRDPIDLKFKAMFGELPGSLVGVWLFRPRHTQDGERAHLCIVRRVRPAR